MTGPHSAGLALAIALAGCALLEHAGKPAGQGGPARERGPQATVSTILPICVLDSMSACAWAASASGKIL